MVNSKAIIVCGIFCLTFSACDNTENEFSNFLNVVIDGKEYSDDSFQTGNGYFTQINSIEGFENFITTIYTPYGEFEAYFLHYANVSDFDMKTGSYQIAENESDINYKDKSLLLYLSSSMTDFYSLKSDGVNNISSIKEIASNNSDVTYLIEGSFNCTFVKGDNSLPITGEYKFSIDLVND